MKMNSIRRTGALAAAAGMCALALAAATTAQAEEKVTAQTLIDRQMILDQITRYYYNFGRATKTEEASFYAEDGVLILGNAAPRKGREAIAGAYGGGARPAAPAAGAAPAAAPAPRPAPPAAAAPAAGAAACPPEAPAAPGAPRARTPFNVTVDNPLIIVHGDTATSEVVFTEYRTQQVDCKPKLVFTTQGKEFATWVKVRGQWLYKTRQITSDSNPPDGWKE